MAAEVLKTFLDIQTAVINEVKEQITDAPVLLRVKRLINMVYRQKVASRQDWHWLQTTIDEVLEIALTTGTMSVTDGSTSITFSSAPAATQAGKLFSTNGFQEIYRISTHTGGAAGAVLEQEYNGPTAATASYKVWDDSIVMPAGTKEIIRVAHAFDSEEMIGEGFQKFRRHQHQHDKQESRPKFFHYNKTSRKLYMWPVLPDDQTLLNIDYKTQVTDLDLDADEPLMPEEDRDVLYYGTLMFAWRIFARNPEEAKENKILYFEKLAQMEGQLRESTEFPRIVTDPTYLANKRRSGRRFENWNPRGSKT